METLSPTEKLSVANCPSSKFHNFKLENNNVKCESCSMRVDDGLPCVAKCNVKCESADYKCNILKCEQCIKVGGIALDIDKDPGIVRDEKLDRDPNVKEELDVVVIDNENWKKPDYEPTVRETVEEKEEKEEIASVPIAEIEEQPKCQKVTKRKLSLDSLSDSRRNRKTNKRALSVGSSQDDPDNEQLTKIVAPIEPLPNKTDGVRTDTSVPKKKQVKKDAQKRKAMTSSVCEIATKKARSSGKQSTGNSIGNCLKRAASDISIMETIDNVIQQSLQMTQKKERKSKNCERTDKKKKRNDDLSSMVKKNAKKTDSAKEMAAEKPPKVASKSSQLKGKDAKPKSKTMQHGKSKNKSKGKTVETKALEIKSRMNETKLDVSKKRDIASKSKAVDVVPEELKKSSIKKKRKNAKKTYVKKTTCKVEDSADGSENPALTKKPFLKPKWSNGWSWEGEPYEAKVYLTVRASLRFSPVILSYHDIAVKITFLQR